MFKTEKKEVVNITSLNMNRETEGRQTNRIHVNFSTMLEKQMA